MDLKDIKKLFGGYGRGAWFSIVDDFWSLKEKPRPFVLVAPWSPGQPVAHVYPRSTSYQRGDHLPHRAHPTGHHPRCCVTKRGSIVRQRIPLPSSYLTGTFACDEPDGAVVAAL